MLKLVETVTSGGKALHFAIDPNGNFLLVANQNSNNAVAFRIDRNSGRLTKFGERDHVVSPVSVAFLKAK
jgi:6-phosphogluconolactonase